MDKPMSDPTPFPLADVLGTITGYLLGDIGGIYRVSEFMIDGPVWTHQLPRVSREVRPAVLLQHPQLEPVITEAEAVTTNNWQELLAGWVARFGETIALVPMSSSVLVEPMGELMQMAPNAAIVIVDRAS